MLDKLGIRVGLVLFCMALTIGQCIFTLGGYAESYYIMLIGRCVFGLGGESMNVAQSSIVSSWFRGKELNFAMGVNLSSSRLGSAFNGLIVPPVYNSTNLGTALLIGAIICGVSFLTAIVIAIIDKRAETLNSAAKATVSEDDKFQWSDLPYMIIVTNMI